MRAVEDKELLLETLRQNECLIATGFDDALIGMTEGMNPVAVYDYWECINCLVRQDGMLWEEAVEFMDFNVLSAYVGEKTPVYIRDFRDYEFELPSR